MSIDATNNTYYYSDSSAYYNNSSTTSVDANNNTYYYSDSSTTSVDETNNDNTSYYSDSTTTSDDSSPDYGDYSNGEWIEAPATQKAEMQEVAEGTNNIVQGEKQANNQAEKVSSVANQNNS